MFFTYNMWKKEKKFLKMADIVSICPPQLMNIGCF